MEIIDGPRLSFVVWKPSQITLHLKYNYIAWWAIQINININRLNIKHSSTRLDGTQMKQIL